MSSLPFSERTIISFIRENGVDQLNTYIYNDDPFSWEYNPFGFHTYPCNIAATGLTPEQQTQLLELLEIVWNNAKTQLQL